MGPLPKNQIKSSSPERIFAPAIMKPAPEASKSVEKKPAAPALGRYAISR